MLPEPTEVSIKASSQVTTELQTAHPQHGRRNDHEPGSRLLPFEGERDNPRCLVSETDASATSPTDLERPIETPLRRLKSDSSSGTRSPVDRIAEYENALNVSPKKGNEGPRFKVVEKKNTKLRDETLSIAAFPNGRLGNGSSFVLNGFLLIQSQRS